jgi:hypothetical protein
MIANAHATQNNSPGARFLGAALEHARTSIRPDISFATQAIAEFLQLGSRHFTAASSMQRSREPASPSIGGASLDFQTFLEQSIIVQTALSLRE